MIDKPAQSNHAIHDLLKERWSPRAFSSQSVPSETLRRILEAARWAPSCFNVQPWRYIVATKENDQAYQTMLHCLVEKNQLWAKSAPVLLIGLIKKTFEANDNTNAHAEHDLGLANAQLTLQAQAEGLFAHQMAGIQRDKIRETYRVPDDFEPIVAIAIGHMGALSDIPEDFHDAEKAERSRKPQAELVFSGSFGTAW